ncbi:MAG: Uncharacterised protein [Prochlorococcus marinus str. MIT 9215]|nr:MAG: Uncharacterised protein [Prochlorococcus marinus str. MIT 9215]
MHGVGIFQHRRVALHGQGNSFPRLINDPANLEVCIQFIASLKVLITNSYHGMYWAQLLGVPTVCVPFSSGHYAFNGEMTYSTHEDSVSNAKQLLSEYRPEARLKARELILENHRLVSSLFYSQAVEFLVD